MTFDKNNLIKDITCCKIMIDNTLIQKINNRNRITEKLASKLNEFNTNILSYENAYIPKNIYHEIIKEYDSRSLEIIKKNITNEHDYFFRSEIKSLSYRDFPLLWRCIFAAILVIPVYVPSLFDDKAFENVDTRDWDRNRLELVEIFVDGARDLG